MGQMNSWTFVAQAENPCGCLLLAEYQMLPSSHLPWLQPLGSKTGIVSSMPNLLWALFSLEPVSTWLSDLV